MVAVFLRGDKLYTSWLGDSQALLVQRGVPLQLVNPHKPDREVCIIVFDCHISISQGGVVELLFLLLFPFY